MNYKEYKGNIFKEDTLLSNEYIIDKLYELDYCNEEIERLNNIINELEKSKEKQINEYEILILKIEKYLNCYQYFLETQEENNKKIANMIHEFSLGSDKVE